MPRSSRKSTLSPTSKTPFISSKIKSSLKKSTNNSKYEEQQTPIQKYLSFVSKYTKSSHTGFTLVELIVVITILSILATVGFITMSHQSSVARDGKRITEIGNLSTSSRLTATQLKRLPIPVSDALALFVDGNGLGGSGSFVGYQGYMSPSLTDPLGYTSDAILDPKDRIPYTYRVGANQDKAQFLAYLENPRFTRSITLASLRDAGEYLIPHAQAYSSEEGAFVERYPYIGGDILGIFIDKTTNAPIQNGTTGVETEVIAPSSSALYTLALTEDVTTSSYSASTLNSMIDESLETKTLLAINAGENTQSSPAPVNCPQNPTHQEYFTFDINTQTITDHHDSGSSEVIIPCTIGGIEVKYIGDNAFAGAEILTKSRDRSFLRNLFSFIPVAQADKGSITSVILPPTLIGIGANAFARNQITAIDIPQSVTAIGYGAFRDNQLTNITIPSSVTNLGEYAFAYNQLTSAIVSEGITHIPTGLFAANHLTSLSLPTSLGTIGNWAFESNELTSIVIPSGVVSIGDYAFLGNQLTSLSIPNSVEHTGLRSFSWNQLPDGQAFIRKSYNTSSPEYTTLMSYGGANNSPTIPSWFNAIGEQAFVYSQLTSVTIPTGITTIENNVFEGNLLSSIDIPNSTTYIGNRAFANNDISNLAIPSSVVHIGYESFEYNSLISVQFPSNNISIGLRAFWNQYNAPGDGSISGPSSGYVKDTYTSNTYSAFDKSKLTNYIDQ